jgi:hypothetical protein
MRRRGCIGAPAVAPPPRDGGSTPSSTAWFGPRQLTWLPWPSTRRRRSDARIFSPTKRSHRPKRPRNGRGLATRAADRPSQHTRAPRACGSSPGRPRGSKAATATWSPWMSARSGGAPTQARLFPDSQTGPEVRRSATPSQPRTNTPTHKHTNTKTHKKNLVSCVRAPVCASEAEQGERSAPLRCGRSPSAPCWGLKAPCWGLKAPCWGLKAPCWGLKAPCWGLKAPCWGLKAPCWAVKAPCWAVKAPCWGLKAPCWGLKAPCWGLKAEGDPVVVQCIAMTTTRPPPPTTPRRRPGASPLSPRKGSPFLAPKRPQNGLGFRQDRRDCTAQPPTHFPSTHPSPPEARTPGRSSCRPRPSPHSCTG